MKLIKILSLTVLLMFSSAAAWASSCYSFVEAEAEQGIRIHSELMVIGLNCQHLAVNVDKNLYTQYREFSSENGRLFAAYETILMNYFQKQGAGNPEDKLNTFRTAVANKISNQAATMRPDVFCYRYAPRIQKAADMDIMDIRRWAATFYPSHPLSQPICEQ